MNSIFTKKFFNILFLIIIILLPLQTRYFLITEKINNNFFEYGTISIYLLNLLVVLFVVYGIIFSFKNKIYLEKKAKIFLILLILFNLSLLLSTFFSTDKSVSIYNNINILILSTFSFIIFINKINMNWFMNCFIISSSIQAFFSIYQFIIQSIYSNKFLGVSEQLSYNLGTYVIEGNFGRILKSYGLFPHPNMLGLFLLIGLLFILIKIMDHKKNKELLETKKIDFKIIYYIYIFGINFLGLLFTFSRISIFLFLILFICCLFYKFYEYIKNKNIKEYKTGFNIFLILIFTLLSISFPSIDILASRVDNNNRLVLQSTNERIYQIKDFIKNIKTKYLVGIGGRNYAINKLNENKQLNVWDLKPIHNVYLLVFLELGLFSFVLYLALILNKFIFNKDFKIIISFIFILLFSIFDHFIWTEYFGLIMFFLFLGLEKYPKYDTIKNAI